MTPSFFILLIAALLPLTSCLLLLQRDPYRALVIRGILGAIAALLYAILGAADVALTEALVGTLLSVTLYAIATRSSMNMKIGMLKADMTLPLFSPIRTCLTRHYIRCETTLYSTPAELETAISAGNIHAIYEPTQQRLTTRIKAFYRILQAELAEEITTLNYVETTGAVKPTAPPNQNLT